MTNLDDLRDFIILNNPTANFKQSELDKMREIVDQLHSSIAWLEKVASEEKDDTKRSDLLKEVTAAKRDLDVWNGRVTKAEKNEQ